MLRIWDSSHPHNEFRVPELVEGALEPLSNVGKDVPATDEAFITVAALDTVASPTETDSNWGTIEYRVCGCDVAAEGKEILEAVIVGLRRRLACPVHPSEQLLIAPRT